MIKTATTKFYNYVQEIFPEHKVIYDLNNPFRAHPWYYRFMLQRELALIFRSIERGLSHLSYEIKVTTGSTCKAEEWYK